MKDQLFELVHGFLCYSHRIVRRVVPGFFCILLSCESFVEVDLPESQLTGEAVYEDYATATAALSDIYARLRDNSFISGSSSGMSVLLGLYADELDYYGVSQQPPEFFYNHTLLPSNTTITTWWNQCYNLIYSVNALIEGVNKSSVLSDAEKRQLQGEALFIRAYIHFYFSELFGDIPYITITDYKENDKVARTPYKEVYPLIVKDLVEAIDLLPQDYISPNRTRPNRAVAQGFLARVYLYHEAWAEAADMASAVVNQTSMYRLEDDLDRVFLKESTSTLWQLSPAEDGQNTQEGATFIFSSTPPPLVALSDEFLNTFEPGDLRKEYCTGEISDEENNWSYPYKYKERNPTATSLEYTILFRLAEQYLIRGEARAQQGDIIGAQEDLNQIRSRAGLNNTKASDKQQLLEAIQRERKTEFFTELGHRWFDLKRTGKADEILPKVKPGWKTTNILFPIPESEILLNPNLLPQNEGY